VIIFTFGGQLTNAMGGEKRRGFPQVLSQEEPDEKQKIVDK
jgi:hypothetical protein